MAYYSIIIHYEELSFGESYKYLYIFDQHTIINIVHSIFVFLYYTCIHNHLTMHLPVTMLDCDYLNVGII